MTPARQVTALRLLLGDGKLEARLSARFGPVTEAPEPWRRHLSVCLDDLTDQGFTTDEVAELRQGLVGILAGLTVHGRGEPAEFLAMEGAGHAP